MKTSIAKEDHVCVLCGKKIPKGERYFIGKDGFHEHANCLDFEDYFTITSTQSQSYYNYND